MTIEDAFGILSSVWRILQTALELKLETSINLVKCLICLHNYLLEEESLETETNKKYATKELIQTIRDNCNLYEKGSINFGYDDDDHDEQVEENDDNDDERERTVICSKEQKIRNTLTEYFENQNNII